MVAERKVIQPLMEVMKIHIQKSFKTQEKNEKIQEDEQKEDHSSEIFKGLEISDVNSEDEVELLTEKGKRVSEYCNLSSSSISSDRSYVLC
jgi:hypothetical protein